MTKSILLTRWFPHCKVSPEEVISVVLVFCCTETHRLTDLFLLFTLQLGEGKSGLNANYSGPPQDYTELHEECLREGKLFEDAAFPATDHSFYLHGRGPRRFKWLRPHEIVDDPQFISQGAHRFDVCQGELGNCWFLAGSIPVTINSGLIGLTLLFPPTPQRSRI